MKLERELERYLAEEKSYIEDGATFSEQDDFGRMVDITAQMVEDIRDDIAACRYLIAIRDGVISPRAY